MQDYLLSGISATQNCIPKDEKLQLLKSSYCSPFSPLFSLLSAAPSQSQASNWLKTNLNEEGQDSDRDELGGKGQKSEKELTGLTGPGTGPCSKRQETALNYFSFTRKICPKKPKPTNQPKKKNPTSDKPQHVLKLLQQPPCVPGMLTLLNRSYIARTKQLQSEKSLSSQAENMEHGLTVPPKFFPSQADNRTHSL